MATLRSRLNQMWIRNVVSHGANAGTAFNNAASPLLNPNRTGYSKRNSDSYNPNNSSAPDYSNPSNYYADENGNFRYDDSIVPDTWINRLNGKYKEEYDRQYAMYLQWFNSAYNQRDQYESAGLNPNLLGSAITGQSNGSGYTINPATGSSAFSNTLDVASKGISLFSSTASIVSSAVKTVGELYGFTEKKFNREVFKALSSNDGSWAKAQSYMSEWSTNTSSNLVQGVINKYKLGNALDENGNNVTDSDGNNITVAEFQASLEYLSSAVDYAVKKVEQKYKSSDLASTYQFNRWKDEYNRRDTVANTLIREALQYIQESEKNQVESHGMPLDWLNYSQDGFAALSEVINDTNLDPTWKGVYLTLLTALKGFSGSASSAVGRSLVGKMF